MLQCVAACYGVLQCVAVCYGVLQCVAVCCSVLQGAAVCCNALQCVAACSALQSVSKSQQKSQSLYRHRPPIECMGWLRLVGSLNYRSLLENIVSFIGLFCNRDL